MTDDRVERVASVIRIATGCANSANWNNCAICKLNVAHSCIVAARAAIAAAEPRWQPIGTAPRDGTRVLIVNAERDQMGTAVFASLEWELVHPISGELMGLGLYPTHWMPVLPLPPPPGDG